MVGFPESTEEMVMVFEENGVQVDLTPSEVDSSGNKELPLSPLCVSREEYELPEELAPALLSSMTTDILPVFFTGGADGFLATV